MTEAIKQIELFKTADYVSALQIVKPTESQWEMLRMHMAAPNYTTTVRQLARTLGYPNWQTTNLLYGKFSGKICNELNVTPSTKLSVFVEFFKAPDSEYELCLRPSVIDGLKELRITSRGHYKKN